MATAKITTYSTTRMVPEETTTTQVELTMSMNEAAAVRRVLRRVAGSRTNSARELTSRVDDALASAGVEPMAVAISGAVLFHENDIAAVALRADDEARQARNGEVVETDKHLRPLSGASAGTIIGDGIEAPKAGDLVRVVAPDKSLGTYREGDIARVMSVRDNGAMWVDFLTPPRGKVPAHVNVLYPREVEVLPKDDRKLIRVVRPVDSFGDYLAGDLAYIEAEDAHAARVEWLTPDPKPDRDDRRGNVLYRAEYARAY